MGVRVMVGALVVVGMRVVGTFVGVPLPPLVGAREGARVTGLFVGACVPETVGAALTTVGTREGV